MSHLVEEILNEEVNPRLVVRKFGWDDWETYAVALIFLWLWGMLSDIGILKKITPCGKPTAALFSAGLMVSLGVLNPLEAVRAIEMGTILLLFGLFVILEFFESLGVVKALTDLVLYGQPSPIMILVRVSMLSGILAAFIMNDGAAIFLTKVVMDICEREHLPLTPYMLVLATSANIGSAATVLGNPKNMVIHSKANLSFIEFALRMAPPAMTCLVLNTCLAVAVNYSVLSKLKLSQPKKRRKSLGAVVLQHMNSTSESRLEEEKIELLSTAPFSSGTESDDDEIDDDDNHLAKLSFRRESSIVEARRSDRSLPQIIREKILSPRKKILYRGSRDNLAKSEYETLQERELRLNAYGQHRGYGAITNSATDSELQRSSSATWQHFSASQHNKHFQPVSTVDIPLKPMNLVKNLNFKELHKAWETYHPDKNAAEEELPRLSLFKKAKKALFTKLKPVEKEDKLTDPEEPAVSSNYTMVNVACNVTLMYTLFLMPGTSMGWACVLSAMSILIFQGTPPEHIYSKINFTLLFYIIALFVTIGAVNKTPLAQSFWSVCEPIIESDNQLVATAGFCVLVFIICLVFTSIPCVLIIAPHLGQLTGQMSSVAWLLLALCVTLCGNITPTSSVAGYIVADCVAKHDPDNGISTATWLKYSFPSVVMCVAIGATILVFL